MVLWEQLLEFIIELCCERLVVREDQGGAFATVKVFPEPVTPRSV